ncbi:MAG: hypothetical protein Q8K48_02175 [Candidatus Planktophila sp.]|nr:hypothetical protein [Candidatus Planktophila sp.]
MKRQLTWKRISVTILGATLVVVAAGLVLTFAISRTPNVDLTVMVFQPVPFDLMTHCGIDELKADGRYFQRVGGILDDGSHNPPPGWDNPSQHGTLTITGEVAVFRDKQGHVETFKVRSGATEFLSICD